MYYEVRHLQTNTLVTTCICKYLADYLALNRTAMARTAGRTDEWVVVPVPGWTP